MLARLKLWAAAISVAVTAFLVLLFKAKADGRRDAQQDARERDHDKASDIRDRVERDLDQRVRDFDDAGYRD